MGNKAGEFIAEKMRSDPDHRSHGTSNGYSYYGCRCDRCKEAHAEKSREYRAEAHAAAYIPRVVHGTRYCYSYYGCRCHRCRQAQSDYSKARADGH